MFFIAGVHWLAMTVWVMLQNTDFCPTMLEERFFNGIVGIIYCFSFFNLKEGRSRYNMIAFYVIMLTENSVLVGVWYHFRNPLVWYNDVILLTTPISFVFGKCLCNLVLLYLE